MDRVRISRAGRERLEELEPLWHSLREHHLGVAPRNGEARAPAESWRWRRAQYERWLGEPESFVLVAEREGLPIGYALVRVREGSPTWKGSERVGELETLVVAGSERSRGVGSALLEAVYAELRAVGVGELALHVLPGNREALDFYGRRGFGTFALWLSADVPS